LLADADTEHPNQMVGMTVFEKGAAPAHFVCDPASTSHRSWKAS